MKNQFYVIVILMAMLSIACTSVKKTVIVTPDQIPPDFQYYKDTLLVLDDKIISGYSKFVKRNFSQYYSGPYKIVSRKEFMSLRENQFRFVFNGFADYDFAGADREKMIQYNLTDTKTGTTYKTRRTKFYSELMINYIKALDAELKKH